MNAKSLAIVWTGVVAIAPIVAAAVVDLAFGSFVLVTLLAATLVFRLSDVLELSFGPLRARMRETLQETDEALERVRSLAQLSATGILNAVISTGRFGGGNDTWKVDLRDRIRSELAKLGVSDDEVRKSEALWNDLVAFDFVGIILGGSQAPSKTEVWPQWKTLRARRPASPPSTLRDFLNEHGWMDEDRAAWIAAYERFLKDGSLDPDRNPFLGEEGRSLGRH
jgi:hypothetical protein